MLGRGLVDWNRRWFGVWGGEGGHTRTRVRVQHRNTLLARGALEESFFGTIVAGAG